MKPNVLIIGAGIGGLTVAHECSDNGIHSSMIEKEAICGGKVATEDRNNFPLDHAVKNISAYYYCFIETLKRIDIGQDKTTFNNLISFDEAEFWLARDQIVTINSQLNESRFKRLRNIIIMAKQLKKSGISYSEIINFGIKHFSYLLFDDTKKQKLDEIGYAEYLKFSDDHQLINLIESVAASSASDSSMACIEQFLKQILKVFNPHNLRSSNNFFCKPATDALIIPWIKQIEKIDNRFKIINNEEVISFEHQNNIINSVVTKNRRLKYNHDFTDVVIATDLHVLKKFNNNSQLGLSLPPGESCEKPALGLFIGLDSLPKNLSSGKYYILTHAPWSIVFLVIDRHVFHDDIYYPRGINAYIWVSITNIVRKGKLCGKSVRECRTEEVLDEFLYSAKLQDIKGTIVEYHLGRGAQFNTDDNKIDINSILFCRSAKHSPIENTTSYDNLFLAGEYTNTIQLTATMEKANESGKRCFSSIANKYNIHYPTEKFEYCDYLPLSKFRKRVKAKKKKEE